MCSFVWRNTLFCRQKSWIIPRRHQWRLVTIGLLSIQIDKYKNNLAYNKFQECWNSKQVGKHGVVRSEKILYHSKKRKFLHWGKYHIAWKELRDLQHFFPYSKYIVDGISQGIVVFEVSNTHVDRTSRLLLGLAFLYIQGLSKVVYPDQLLGAVQYTHIVLR